MLVLACFILSTKQELKIHVLLRIFALVTTLKTLFLNSPAIFFYLNAIYWAGGISIFLINTLGLSIKKQMSDEIPKLACFGYFLGRLYHFLIWSKDIKIAKAIESTFIGDISIDSTSAKGIFI